MTFPCVFLACFLCLCVGLVIGFAMSADRLDTIQRARNGGF